MERSIISKENLAKVIAKNTNQLEQRVIDWANRVSFEEVLRWATEKDIEECQKKYNELKS